MLMNKLCEMEITFHLQWQQKFEPIDQQQYKNNTTMLNYKRIRQNKSDKIERSQDLMQIIILSFDHPRND